MLKRCRRETLQAGRLSVTDTQVCCKDNLAAAGITHRGEDKWGGPRLVVAAGSVRAVELMLDEPNQIADSVRVVEFAH